MSTSFVPGQTFNVPAADVADLILLMQRAVTCANRQGSTVISSAGDSGTNRNFTREMVVLPADLPGVISVSATGPMGWALDFSTDLDRPASYTEHGRARIDFAAPGGNFMLPGEDPCVVAGIGAPCWAFDMVLGTTPTGWGWSAGTSMASPHVAGVAALIIGANGGPMHPSQVEARLRRSADQPGQGGRDVHFGLGRVNAARAVGAM